MFSIYRWVDSALFTGWVHKYIRVWRPSPRRNKADPISTMNSRSVQWTAGQLISVPAARPFRLQRCFRGSRGLARCSLQPEEAVDAEVMEVGEVEGFGEVQEVLSSDGIAGFEEGLSVEKTKAVDEGAERSPCDLELDAVLQKELKENGEEWRIDL